MKVFWIETATVHHKKMTVTSLEDESTRRGNNSKPQSFPIKHWHLSSAEFKPPLLLESHNVLGKLPLLLRASTHPLPSSDIHSTAAPPHHPHACLVQVLVWAHRFLVTEQKVIFFPLPTQSSNRINLNYYVKRNQLCNRSLREIWFCFQDLFPLC